MVDDPVVWELFLPDVALYRHSMPNVKFHQRYSTFYFSNRGTTRFPTEKLTVLSGGVFEGIRVPADA